MGTVFLVLSHSNPFALKITHSLPSKKQRSHVERDILASLHHPFLQTLHAHFEFGNHSLFLLDFCPGGDLNVLRHRQPEKRFSETAARFYAAEVLVALEHLHKLSIVYRDLKPENILVQGSGHIKLTDFDLSLPLQQQAAIKPTAINVWPVATGTLRQHILAEAHSDSKAQQLCLHPLAKKLWKLRKSTEGSKEHIVSVGAAAHEGNVSIRASTTKQTCNLCRLQCLGLNGTVSLRRRKKCFSKQGYLSRGSGDKKASKERSKAKRVSKLRRRTHNSVLCFPHLNLSRPCKNMEERYVCVVGTDEYVAPEVLRGEEQGFSMDWWSFGVFLYEMIYGDTPFKGPNSQETLCNILEKEPEFPGMKSPAKHLIAQLLVKDPAARLGTVRGALDIKQHPFFSGLNWDSLPYICRPPFIPRPLCLSELEERYNSSACKLKSDQGDHDQGMHNYEGTEQKLTPKFWLDEVVASIEAAAGKYKNGQHTSSQYSPSSSSAGFQSSSVDGVDRELQRDGEVDQRFSSADWSSELEAAGKRTPPASSLM
ncbi:hypothetical protein GOP47_0013444 [Adiantum capillus-veneris]|uniref:non-specific serine/threonine protein kinase n=1 Tax=Adiantum capillus-veneris TaxID=13818 RepID=A0A9D4UPS8_ADICA|nr:hypothetical protein GOP47_0013444 [Adiantum capillus-veneris]